MYDALCLTEIPVLRLSHLQMYTVGLLKCMCNLLLAIEEEETTEIILGSEKCWIMWTCRVFVGT